MNYKKITTPLSHISKITTSKPIKIYGIISNKDESISIYEICNVISEIDFIDYSMDILEKYSDQPINSKTLNIPYNQLVLLCIYGLYGNLNDRNLHQVYENIKKGFPVNNPFKFYLYYTCDQDNFNIKVS